MVVGLGLDKAESRQRKGELDRVAAMLSRLGGRGYSVKEGSGEYGYTEFDPDPDPDSDSDKIESNCMSLYPKLLALSSN